jgi:hypothetical protein
VRWDPFRHARTRGAWREQLLIAQKGRCALCGFRFPDAGEFDLTVDKGFAVTFDHIVPVSRGGSNALQNLRLVHAACNHLRGDADTLKRLPPFPRSLKADAFTVPKKVWIDDRGEAWCRNRKWKPVYRSLRDAWIGVVRTFLQTGRITTPYRCNRSIFRFAVARYRVSGSPLASAPIIGWVASVKHRTVGCQMWHLTSLTGHLLAYRQPIALMKGAPWPAYHRAPNGTWVRRDRECVRSDGAAKKCFATFEAAERCAKAMSVPQGKRGQRYHAYICSGGHIHIAKALA